MIPIPLLLWFASAILAQGDYDSGYDYNISFKCTVVDNTAMLSWNQNEVMRLKQDIYSGNVVCDNVLYSICTWRQDNLFGFLPENLTNLLGIQGQCEAMLSYDAKFTTQCYQFSEKLRVATNVKYFTFRIDWLMGGNLCTLLQRYLVTCVHKLLRLIMMGVTFGGH